MTSQPKSKPMTNRDLLRNLMVGQVVTLTADGVLLDPIVAEVVAVADADSLSCRTTVRRDDNGRFEHLYLNQAGVVIMSHRDGSYTNGVTVTY